MLPFAARSERRAGAGATFVPFFVVAAWLAWLGAGALVDEVNLLAGTDNLPGSFSLGNTLPLVARLEGGGRGIMRNIEYIYIYIYIYSIHM